MPQLACSASCGAKICFTSGSFARWSYECARMCFGPMHASDALLYLIVIIIAARGGGEIAERFHQPPVLGEMLAGVVLGLVPFIRPAVDNEAILFVAEIGVILLLFEVGLESELDEFFRVGIPAALVACIGVALPLGITPAIAILLGYGAHMAWFLGGTLTATSVGITARVFSDLGRLQSKEARIIIGAAVVDDILGLLVLAVVLSLAAGAPIRVGNVMLTVAIAVGFLAAAIVIGRRAAKFLIGLAANMRGRGVLVVSAFTFGLVLAYVAAKLGLAAIVGAFAAGLVLASTEHRVHITERIQPVADIFVPVFFALVGMQVDLRLLNPAERGGWALIGLAAALLLVAVPTKVAAGLGALKQNVNKVAVGVGMVPRGEVGLIFASLGLHNGILGRGVYGAVIIVLLITTLIAPPWLKYQLSRTTRPSRRRRSERPADAT